MINSLKYSIILRATALAVACGFLFASCGSNGDDPEPPQPVAERAVVVYMVASNSLGSYSYDESDISEMLFAARSGGLRDGRLLIYHQNYDGMPVLKEVTATGLDTLVKYANTVSSLSIARMKKVISDVKTEVPAKEYGIILWSHGNGWIKAGSAHSGEIPISTRAFGEEKGIDSTTRYMDVESLASALSGEDLAFGYFDCCYMGGVEVLYDLRNTVPRLVASVAELPAAGMPYDRTLPYIMAPGEADLEGAARATFDYYDSLTGQNRTCTMSVYNMEHVGELADALRDLYSWHPVTPEGYEPQKFMTERTCHYYDLKDYVENLNITGSAEAAEIAAFEADRQKVIDAIANTVTYSAATPYIWNTLPVGHHCGISTQFLTSDVMAEKYGYSDTAWWKDVAYRLFGE